MVQSEEEHDTRKIEINHQAMLGVSNPRTYRIEDMIKGHVLSLLVDSKSTHNFQQEHVARLLKLPIQLSLLFS